MARAWRLGAKVLAVYDVPTEDGLPWGVMRLVEGVSLAQELKRRTRLGPERASEIALGVPTALRAAHRLGIVHRDVKPANITPAANRTSASAIMAAVAFEPHPPLRNAGALTVLIEQLLTKQRADRPPASDAIAALRVLSGASARRGRTRPWRADRCPDGGRGTAGDASGTERPRPPSCAAAPSLRGAARGPGRSAAPSR
ncbi:hypothetical protein ACGFXC_33120 [Streptomyces sp. NPDC048507]|uniref:protein kinase domain-containing protein n=1 Tax=Streptomyces sp. NPDC048507 TaxID=3365560 RepID=UPI003714EC20